MGTELFRRTAVHFPDTNAFWLGAKSGELLICHTRTSNEVVELPQRRYLQNAGLNQSTNSTYYNFIWKTPLKLDLCPSFSDLQYGITYIGNFFQCSVAKTCLSLRSPISLIFCWKLASSIIRILPPLSAGSLGHLSHNVKLTVIPEQDTGPQLHLFQLALIIPVWKYVPISEAVGHVSLLG